MVTYSALVAGCGVLTAWGSRSLLAGLVAAAAALTIPPLFAFGHFANTDLFLAAFWFGTAASLFAYTETDRRIWLITTGLLFGAACTTKFTGVLLLPVLLIWLVLRGRRDLRPLLIVLSIGGLVFFAVNPVMWVDPIQGSWDYVKAGLFRSISVHISTLYFGTVYTFRGPWHFPFVWTAIVIPIPLLFALGLGLTHRGAGRLRMLVLVNLGVLYGVTLLPATPLHDGIRLFLPVFPFLCVLAGLGTRRAFEILQSRGPKWLAGRPHALAGALLVAVLVLPAMRTAQYHPHQLSYFNALIGGVRGANARGLEVTTQKEVLNRAVLADLRESIPGGTVIDPGFQMEEICFYQAVGWAPRDWVAEGTLVVGGEERYTGCEGPESFLRVRLTREARKPAFMFVYHRYTMMQVQDLAPVDFGEPPFYEVSVQGVPLMQVYEIR